MTGRTVIGCHSVISVMSRIGDVMTTDPRDPLLPDALPLGITACERPAVNGMGHGREEEDRLLMEGMRADSLARRPGTEVSKTMIPST